VHFPNFQIPLAENQFLFGLWVSRPRNPNNTGQIAVADQIGTANSEVLHECKARNSAAFDRDQDATMASGRKTSIRCSRLSACASPEKLLETVRSFSGGHAAIKSQRAFRLRVGGLL
jgi:hypothetical protein